jgi:hypothetical protein
VRLGGQRVVGRLAAVAQNDPEQQALDEHEHGDRDPEDVDIEVEHVLPVLVDRRNGEEAGRLLAARVGGTWRGGFDAAEEQQREWNERADSQGDVSPAGLAGAT